MDDPLIMRCGRRLFGSICRKIDSITGKLPSGSMIKNNMTAADIISTGKKSAMESDRVVLPIPVGPTKINTSRFLSNSFKFTIEFI